MMVQVDSIELARLRGIEREWVKMRLGGQRFYTILRAVASFYDVSANEITSASREVDVTFARHVAMYITRRKTELSLQQIGDRFGKRDHSTVLHAVERIEGLFFEDQAVRAQIEVLEREILGRAA